MSSLYLNHFALSSPPFSITPDLGFFFEGKERGTFATGLLYATLQAEGIVLVVGEVGSGKTLMSRILLDRLPKHVDTVYLPNPAFFPNEIIDVICRDLGINDAQPHEGTRLEMLQQELIRRYAMGREVVVVIDEAHTMPADSIEEVRRLSNLETGNRKLMQIVLFGQPELDVVLEAPHLRQVRDRVVYRLTLSNLSKEDSHAYLDYRLRVAGWRGGRMFTRFAERRLLADAMGRTRRINLLADKAMLAAYVDNAKQVRAKHVRRAIRDAGANFATTRTNSSGLWKAVAAFLSVIAIAGGGAALHGVFQPDQVQGVTVSSSPPVQNASAAANSIPETLVHAVTSVQPAAGSTAKLAAAPTPDDNTDAMALVQQIAINEGNAALYKTSHQEHVQGSTDSPVQAVAASLPEHLSRRVQQSYNYARQESSRGNYGIQLATAPIATGIETYIAEAEKIYSPSLIHIRRAPYGEEARYVIYLGSFATHEAAKLAMAKLPQSWLKDKPLVKSWKEIYDVPWML